MEFFRFRSIDFNPGIPPQVHHATWMIDSFTSEPYADKQPFMIQDKAQQLMPLKRFLTSLKNDIKETNEAIEKVRRAAPHVQYVYHCCIGANESY